MKKVKKWICQTNTAHIFDKPASDGFCPRCPNFTGILVEQEFDIDLAPEPGNKNPNTERTGMQKIKKWVCNIDATHIFDEPAQDYFCPECPSFTGILAVQEFDTDQLQQQDNKI